MFKRAWKVLFKQGRGYEGNWGGSNHIFPTEKKRVEIELSKASFSGCKLFRTSYMNLFSSRVSKTGDQKSLLFSGKLRPWTDF